MKPIKRIMCAMRTRSDGEWYSSAHYQNIELGSEDISFALSTVMKTHMILEIYERKEKN